MAGVSVEVIDRVTPQLNRALQSLTDFRRPLAMAGQYMFRETKEQFETRGLRSGDPWPPLARSTVRRRRKRSDAPLQDTGRLRASVVGNRAAGSIYDLQRDTLKIGTKLEYARIHQLGGIIQRVTKAGMGILSRRGTTGAFRFTKQNAGTMTSIGAARKQMAQREEYAYRVQMGFSTKGLRFVHSSKIRQFRSVSWMGGKPYFIRIPQRKFLVVTAENLKYISGDIFRRWLMGMFR